MRALTHYQTYPERPPGADLPPKKVCNLGPMAPRPNGITVSAVETRAFHREARFSPGDQCYHWNNNCESYWRVGVAMGESMLELISRRED